jgi:hypothetical protein
LSRLVYKNSNYWLKKFNLETNPSYFGDKDTPKKEKLCPKCKTVKLSNDFGNRKDRPRELLGYCRDCNNTSFLDRRAFKQKCIDYKGGSCESCGYSKCIASFDFHHRDSSKKEFSVSRRRGFSDEVKAELDKCDLLCANCHREIHFNLKNG